MYSPGKVKKCGIMSIAPQINDSNLYWQYHKKDFIKNLTMDYAISYGLKWPKQQI